MTVDELRKQLAGVDGGRIVVMSSDGEGNSFSPLADLDDESVYVAESTWSGEVRYSTLTEEMRLHGYTEEDVYIGDDAQPALVLWPTN